jgi:ribosomal protein L11 methyltransferase
MSWLALTLEVDPAAAEAFSDALLEAGACSVSWHGLDGPRPALQALLASDAAPEAIVARAAAALGAPAPAYAVDILEDEDWVRRSQAQFEPLRVGKRLWVGPSWCEPPEDAAAVVRLDPGLAFGTGSHPSTRLVLRFLERSIQGGERVLDYGCGSGILAIAAAKLGAARVDAVDVDPVAVETTTANARDNGVAIRAAVPDALPAAAYAMVVSNILAQPLILLAPLLAARCAPGGRLALAGILQTQAAEVIDAYKPWLSLRVESLHDGWVLLAGIRQR